MEIQIILVRPQKLEMRRKPLKKAYKYRLLYWQCAANMGRMKGYMDIFNDLYNSSQVCSLQNYELEIRHYVENNVDCLVELT